MTSNLQALTFDANDPLRLARFWAGVLGWETAEDGTVIVPNDHAGFQIWFHPTEEQKTGPNQMHFDLTSKPSRTRSGRWRGRSLAGRHIDIGQLPEEGHVVLADPEDNSSIGLPRIPVGTAA